MNPDCIWSRASGRAPLFLAALVAGACATTVASAQTTPYTRTQYASTYVPITNGTPVAFTSLDDDIVSIPIGFSFSFYGTSYTSISVDTNGVLVLGSAPFSSFSNTGLPDPATPNGVLAPWWDDLFLTTGAVTYTVLGAAPNRELVIQYAAVGHYDFLGPSMSNLTVQVRLSEAGGAIRFHYGTFNQVTAENPLWTGTIGIENTTGTEAVLGLPCAAMGSCGAADLVALNNQVVEISTPSGVELVPTGVAPSGGNPGDTVSFNVTARNIGTLSATTAFDAAVYLSTDATIDATDTLLGTVTFNPPLAPQGAVTATLTTALPTVPSAFYNVGVILDSGNAVAETLEANNTIILNPNFLVGSDLAAEIDTPADSGAGETVDITVRLLNLGAAQNAVFVRVYYSNDQNLDASDTVVTTATVAVPAQPSTEFRFPTVLPTLTPARYYAIVEVDPNNTIVEADETNNLAVSANQALLEGPDLTADNIDATGDFAFRGGMLEVFGTIGNEGLATATDFYYGIYLSENQLCSAVSDPLLQDFGPVTLAPQSTVSFSHMVPVPANLNAVPHHVCLIVNNRSTVLEGNQNNNIDRTQRTLDVRDPQADFTITEVRLPERAAAGESVTIQRTLLNAGNAPGASDYAIYLSLDANLDPMQDILLTTPSATIPAAAEDIDVDVVQIPAAVSAGAYYIIYEMDPGDAVAELFEDNNVLASGGTLALLPSDLVILTQSLPVATVNVPYDVVLAAAGGAGAHTWTVQAGMLPAGLTLDAATGRLSGTPTAPAASELTIAVTDGALTITRDYALLVADRTTPLEVATTALPPGFSNRPYRYPLTAFGGVPPYSWEILGPDQAPDGVFFTPDGVFDGTPSAPGLAQLNLRVTDALGAVAERPLVLRVVDGSDSVRLSNDVLPDGRMGDMYDETFRVASGTGSSPFTFAFAGGELPSGLSMEGERIFGVPDRAGIFVFSVRVSDSRGDFDVNAYVVEIEQGNDGVTLVTNALPAGEIDAEYLDEGEPVQIRAVSANANTITVAIVDGELPPGLLMAEDGTITGVPSAVGAFSFLVLATDDLGQQDVRAYGIVVEAPVAPPPGVGTDDGCRCVQAEGPDASALWWLLAPALLVLRRRRKVGCSLALAVGFALSPSLAEAQVPYFLDTRTETYTEMPGGTVLQFQFSNDDGDAQVALPFPFRYYGTDHSSVNVGTNGLIVFGGGANSLANTALPSSGTPNNLIAPWWQDLITNRATTHEMGTAPNRIFVIQYEQVQAFFGGVGNPKFQIWLYEGPGGRFEVRYGPGTGIGMGWGASAGWEGPMGAEGGNFLSCTSPSCDGPTLVSAANLVVRVQADAGPDISAAGIDVPPVVYAGVPFATNVRVSSLHQNPLGPFVYTVHAMGPNDVTPNRPIFTSDPITLAPYAQLTTTATPTVPLNLPNGRYRLAVVVDSANQLTEPDENNNTFISTDTLRLAPQQPDFVVSSVTTGAGSAAPGATLSVTAYLRNRGNLDSAAAYSLVLSSNPVVSQEDIVLDQGMVDLARLTTATVTVDVTIPSDTPAGQYYLGAVLDPTNAVPEIDEVNNSNVVDAPVSIASGSVEAVTQALPGGYIGIDYTHFLRARGGDGAYDWTITSGSLPMGLNLVPNRGEIRGRPTAAGQADLTFQVESAGQTDTVQLTLTVAEPDGGLTIVTTQLLPGTVGGAYPPVEAGTQPEDAPRIVALGGSEPATFTAEGSLPAGLTLDADGYLHGVPAQAGTFDIEILATAGGEEARRTLPLTIGTPGRLTIVADVLPDGRLGDSYDFTLRAIGRSRTATVTFTAQGPLPPGIIVAADGRVLGTPESVGTWVFTVVAAEGTGAGAVSDSANFRMTVVEDEGFEIVETTLPEATVGVDYEAALSTRGGGAPYTWRVMGPPLPRGLEFEVFMDRGVEERLRFRGTPEEEDTVTVLVTVTDASGRFAQRPLTMVVRTPPAPPPVVDAGGCTGLQGPSDVAPLGLLLVALGFGRRRSRRCSR